MSSFSDSIRKVRNFCAERRRKTSIYTVRLHLNRKIGESAFATPFSITTPLIINKSPDEHKIKYKGLHAIRRRITTILAAAVYSARDFIHSGSTPRFPDWPLPKISSEKIILNVCGTLKRCSARAKKDGVGTHYGIS